MTAAHPVHQAEVAHALPAVGAIRRAGAGATPGSPFAQGRELVRYTRADEQIVLSKASGAETVRRLMPGRCWGTELVDTIKRTPWRTADVTRSRPPRRQDEAEPS